MGKNGENVPKFKRDKSLIEGKRRHVPFASGPYKVIGVRDIMTGTSDSGESGSILARLYYPASDQNRCIKDQLLFWPNWLPHENYRRGYADVGDIKSESTIKFLNWLVGDAFIPVVANSRPLRTPELESQKLPVIIFSHGMGGCRTTYSGICTEMASNGFFVAAIEHRDGTACASFYAKEVDIPLTEDNLDTSLPIVDGLGPPLISKKDNGTKLIPTTISEEDEQNEDEIQQETSDHIKRSKNSNGTKPKNGIKKTSSSYVPQTIMEWVKYKNIKDDDPEYYEKRSSQVQMRAKDCIELLNVVEKMNSGIDIQNLMDGLLDPREFKNLLDMNKIIMMGHSMGGATSILTASVETSRIKAVVCLDTWMYPIHKKISELKLRQPIIFINSQKFQTKNNLRKIQELIQLSSDDQNDSSTTDGSNIRRDVMMIRGSVHYNQTDIPFIFSYLAKLIFGGASKRDKFTVHDLTCSMAIRFLSDVFNLESDGSRERFIRKHHKIIKEGFSKKL